MKALPLFALLATLASCQTFTQSRSVKPDSVLVRARHADSPAELAAFLKLPADKLDDYYINQRLTASPLDSSPDQLGNIQFAPDANGTYPLIIQSLTPSHDDNNHH
ncbi:hypothetical protein [Spirosoma endbachense]|uniref:Uncharacterized protein n=1 Tax=Spirosoma endbachense TaxID=2666025 RepID=A0A6P1W1H3_9BACT|nr:hypothetical protein [Spirosoma endbachense]QHV97867.1 hypothetical protein GJR95_23935 [Spirosoma endbachense]